MAQTARKIEWPDGTHTYHLTPENSAPERHDVPPAPSRRMMDDPRIAARAEMVNAFRQWRQLHPALGKTEAGKSFVQAYHSGFVAVSDATREACKVVSLRTLYRWHKAHGDGGTPGLKPGGNGGGGGPRVRITGKLDEFFRSLVGNNPDHVTANYLMKAAVADGHDVPGVRSVRRWLGRYRIENAARLRALANPDEWKSKHLPAYGSRSEHVTALNALWELDSTLADVMCSDGKRYALLVCIDVWSRRARAVLAPTSSARDLAATLLRRCLLELGKPECVVSDNGKDYTSRHLSGVFLDLNVAHVLTPPFSPEKKPHVERFIKTISHGLFAHLPGFVGHNVAQGQAIRAKDAFGQRRSLGHASRHSVEELQAKIDQWNEFVYERDPHSDLGCSPWQKAAGWNGEVVTVNEAGLDILLAPPPKGGEFRVVGKSGVKCETGMYVDGALGPWVGERVKVRVDPTERGIIYLFAPEPGGAFICTAKDVHLLGKERAKVAVAAIRKAKEQRNEWRAEQRALAREHRPDEAMDRILAHAEREAAKVVPIREAGTVEHVTPAQAAAAKAESDPARERARKRAAERAELDAKASAQNEQRWRDHMSIWWTDEDSSDFNRAARQLSENDIMRKLWR
ncbi:MAG: DDE-type integrase/transposase/recombinase [Boseongicola sp.]|nr:DDE-type integrase/transposase/recombinase [Boseongicola sp.]